MIIWGSKAKERTVGGGVFFCPGCRLDAAYQSIRVSRYFTLYFIPLFPTSTLGEYVKCNSCSSTFNPGVAQLSRDQVLSLIEPWQCAKCDNRNPASESSCLACGTVRASKGPPPLPGASPALPGPSQELS